MRTVQTIDDFIDCKYTLSFFCSCKNHRFADMEALKKEYGGKTNALEAGKYSSCPNCGKAGEAHIQIQAGLGLWRKE